jgi:hypothetical protein
MSHNNHYNTNNDAYQRRKKARLDLRLADPSAAAHLDGDDRAYFRHI